MAKNAMRWKEKHQKIMSLKPRKWLRCRGLRRQQFLSLKTRGLVLYPAHWPTWRVPYIVAARRFYWRSFMSITGQEEQFRVFPTRKKWSSLLKPIPSAHPPYWRSLRASCRARCIARRAAYARLKRALEGA